jgi:hypothetical protein
MNNPTRVARVASAVLLAVSALTACRSEGATPQQANQTQPSEIPSKTRTGYAIHDVWKVGSGPGQHMDGKSCESPHGPWHVVISADLAAYGWASFNAYLDVTLDPATGKGTVRGEEHSVGTNGDTYDGPTTGTAELTPDGSNYLIKMELDHDIVWKTKTAVQLPGQERIKGHKSRELHVVPATKQDCP